MKKVLLVFGTRPEAIKMAPLVKALSAQPDKFDTKVCVTAQHREMLDQVLRIFDIVPDYDLNIMKQGQDLYDITSRVLLGLREVLKESQPDIVLVHGDTTTSMAAALAAFYQQIPVGHVEAGLRTHNIYSPWPEEMNRQMTGRITTLHLAPTPLSASNLESEGVDKQKIHVTGNTVIDALHLVIEKIKTKPEAEIEILKHLETEGISQNLLKQWQLGSQAIRARVEGKTVNAENEGRKLVLITGHRRENFGDGFLNICHAIKELALAHPDVDFVYPVHLNPNVLAPVKEILGGGSSDKISALNNVYLLHPLDYLPFVYMMSRSFLVLTDSGGIQEEAPGLGKPVLVMRDTTERPEAVDAGTVLLVGTVKERIVKEVDRLLTDLPHYAKMSQANNPYGDGQACQRIANAILQA
jgi:UDP-N-acetylglucosamine 2-epimerase (non-hydrolysing)